MHSLDFLSDSPKYFIFHKNANKTNLGGVVFILFMIIILFITTFYLYDYFYDIYMDQKYEISASTIEEIIGEENDEKLKSESEMNPKISFNIELYNYNFTPLSDNFLIKPWKNIKMERNVTFECKVSDLIFNIFYKCPNENCALLEKDKSLFNYWVRISYSGFKLNHQSDGAPLTKNNNLIFFEEFPFYFQNTLIRYLNWEIIKYNDESKGFMRLYDKIMKKNRIYWAGTISSKEYYPLDNSFYGYEYNNESFLFLGRVIMKNFQDKFTEYKRTKKSFMDVLANIVALVSSFYSIISYGFINFYSTTFDNYKIVEKILNNKIKINLPNNNKNNKEIELTNDFKGLDNLMSNQSMDNLIINDDNIDNNENNDNYNNKEKGNNYSYKDILRKETISTFPKFRLYHFLLNNLYEIAPLKKSNVYEFLCLCNEILSKYISIDYILYNQIKLENLFKDYKWNNPELNNIENNELINKLQNFI